MDDARQPQTSAPSSEIEREIRQGRKFTAQEAVSRMAGPGAMKGASPVSAVQQAETEIGTWLRAQVADPPGALQAVLGCNLKGSPLLLDNVDQPLLALGAYCQDVLGSTYHLEELVRETDAEWGRRMDEKPHFERAGAPPDPDDPYTVASVRALLVAIAADCACPQNTDKPRSGNGAGGRT